MHRHMLHLLKTNNDLHHLHKHINNLPARGSNRGRSTNEKAAAKRKVFHSYWRIICQFIPKVEAIGHVEADSDKNAEPLPKNLDYSLRCAYCPDVPRHDREQCWHLKRAVQKLIDAGDIIVQNPDATDTSQRPLLVHDETYMEGMVCVENGYESSSKFLCKLLVAKFSVLSVSVLEVYLKNELVKGTQKHLLRSM